MRRNALLQTIQENSFTTLDKTRNGFQFTKRIRSNKKLPLVSYSPRTVKWQVGLQWLCIVLTGHLTFPDTHNSTSLQIHSKKNTILNLVRFKTSNKILKTETKQLGTIIYHISNHIITSPLEANMIWRMNKPLPVQWPTQNYHDLHVWNPHRHMFLALFL